jgi:membrane protein
VEVRRRHFVVSALIPYCYMFCLGLGLLVMTMVSGSLQLMGAESIELVGGSWSLRGISGSLIYALGVIGEILVLTSIYLVMRVGKPSLRHALIGGVTATVLWEITRHVLLWYFGTLSQVGLVYGSLASSIVLLLSFEIGATLVLLGAQVIAEYENIGLQSPAAAPVPLQTDAVGT